MTVPPAPGRTGGAIYALAAIPVLFWGSSFVATKVALRAFGPWDIVGLRSLLGVAVLLAATPWRRRATLDEPRAGDGVKTLLLGILGLPVHLALQAWALTLTSAVHSGWLITLNPVFTSTLAALVLRERFPPAKAGGLALGLAGALTVIAGRHGLATLAFPGTRGDLLVLLSSLNWAAYTLLARDLAVRRDPFRLTARALAAGSVASTALWLALGHPAGAAGASLEGWVAIVFLGVGCTGAGYLAWSAALERLEAGTLSSFQFVQPLVTVAVARVWIGESAGMTVLAGGALVLGGVALVQRGARVAPASRRESRYI